jgi:hypothetical protein
LKRLPAGEDSYTYVALSHPWGDTTKYQTFGTYPEDLKKFKNEIQWDALPDTFKHAVQTTRALGKRYLWIDSVCILQGPAGDFQAEANRMQDAFGNAYCSTAASRADNHRSGFLNPRRQRAYYKFRSSSDRSFYVCEPIDDFKTDLLEGSLNQRAWVLQERALARRTVFFTASQTYFECGEGIRCETLSRLRQ